jgi:lipopolysaccharide/colanic/teichoic acid biosynthesis glycosyltransferase
MYSKEVAAMTYDKLTIGRVHMPLRHDATHERQKDGPRRRWYIPAKLAMEWLAALLALVVCSPLIGLMALLTRITSPGPAFYTQIRAGRGGRPFTMVKIRTMRCDSEAKTGPVWCGADDNRVTRLGRFLRETHLDELPQLINVLQGKMSLIGPRPERPEIIDRIERSLPRYHERLLLRPGLTGLAQVQRPPDADLEDVRKKLVYDLYYVREVSPMMDLRVAVSTALQMTGVALHAVGKLLVRGYGADADQLDATVPLLPEEPPPQRAAEVA